MAGSTWVGIQEPASASQTARLGAHSYTQGSTAVYREETVLTGTASGDIIQFASAAPATNLIAPVVRALAEVQSLPLLTTGSKLQVEPISGAAFPISGNTTAILTTGSKLQVEPIAGAVFPISGNASVVVTAQPGMAQINASGGSTIHLMGGMDGNTSNSTARALKVNTSQELVITGAVTVAQVTSAVLSNTSGNITTANPLAVYLQDSTATLAIKGNASVTLTGLPGAVQINTSAGTTALLIAGADGGTSNSTARVLRTNTSGELQVNITNTPTVNVQGNTTAILSTASIVQVEPKAAAVFPISGNVTALLSTAFPAYVPFAGTTASGGLVMMGLDANATNATARAIRVDASGKLLVDAGSLTVGGLVAINTSGGTTMMLVGGQDGGTSNSTARTLNVNASRELLITGPVTISGNASVVVTALPGAVQINTSGGSTMLIVGGVDGGTSNSTARAFRTNTSGEQLVIVNNTPTVNIQGNATAILTTGSIVQVEPKAAAVFPISGNTTAIISTASKILIDGAAGFVLPVGLQMNNVYQGSTALAPQYAAINVSASGVVAVVASGSVRVVVQALAFTNLTSGLVRFLTSNTALTGFMPIDARSGFVLPWNPMGWFRTATGEALNIELSGTSGAGGGMLQYVTPST